jgi:hypothetical protein
MAHDDLYQRADDRDLAPRFGDEVDGGLQSFEREPRTSGLAVASLVSSLVFCCPLVTVFGPILGIAYFAAAAGKPWLRGRGLAIAGIVVGTLATAVAALGLWAMVSMFFRAMELPGEAIAKIEQGDEAGVRELFMPGSIPSGSREIEAFAAELDARYGAFVSATVDQMAPPPVGGPEQAIVVPMLLTFERGTVSAICELAPSQTGFELQLRSIEIVDPELGNLRLPSDGLPGEPPDADAEAESETERRGDAEEAAP